MPSKYVRKVEDVDVLDAARSKLWGELESNNLKEWDQEKMVVTLDLSEIWLRSDGKRKCPYNKKEPIYSLSKQTPDMPTLEEIQEIS